MRFASLCINALVVLPFLFGFGVLVPVVSHAEIPDGVSCSLENDVLVCSDGSYPVSEYCHVDAGVLVCGDDSVGGGDVCMTSPDGSRTCVNNGITENPSPGVYLGDGLGTVHDLPSSPPGSGWLSRLSHWFAYAIHAVFRSIASFLRDLVVFAISCVFSVFLVAVRAIGVPNFMQNASMGSILGQAGPLVGFFLVKLRVVDGLALISGGYLFRLTRKLFTLGQW